MDATTRRSSPTKAINACPNADLQWCVAPGLVSIPIATPITAENVGISAAITKSAIADRANRQVRRRARPHAIPIVGVVARRVSMCSPIRKTAVHVASPAPMASLASTENAMSSPLANVAMAKFATKTAIASSNAVRRFAAPMNRAAATLVRRSTPSNTADLAITPAKAMPPSANTAHAPTNARHKHAKPKVPNVEPSTTDAAMHSIADRAPMPRSALRINASIPLAAPRLARQRAKTAAPSTTVAAESSTVAPARGQKNAKTTSAPIPNANQRLVPNKVKNADR